MDHGETFPHKPKRPADSELDIAVISEPVVDTFSTIAEEITQLLCNTNDIDDIQRCPGACLKVLVTRPQEVLDLAHTKLHTWPYHRLQRHWRRLYEDASLSLAAKRLRELVTATTDPRLSTKRLKPQESNQARGQLGPIVTILDKAIIIAGAPARKQYIENILTRLRGLFAETNELRGDLALHVIKPEVPLSQNLILRKLTPPDFQEFQAHLDGPMTPVIISGSFEHWPAIKRWTSLPYLMQSTLDGHRMVPVEIGDNYAADAWTQRLLTFYDFVHHFLSPEDPEETGYLAQYDLLQHIPILRDDLYIPDYCYTAPPPPRGSALMTAGLAEASPIDDPLLNAWLGPKGTKTPLHTDPYHNILCQVVGYKYVRLYSPEEAPNIYPRSADEAGVSMANTTQLDVRYFRPRGASVDECFAEDAELSDLFPLFKQAKYQEGILAPGDCVYIPLGWWHYVESLTTSFSVSFWWN